MNLISMKKENTIKKVKRSLLQRGMDTENGREMIPSYFVFACICIANDWILPTYIEFYLRTLDLLNGVTMK